MRTMTAGTVAVRRANAGDVPHIVALSAEDDLRIQGNEADPHDPVYRSAFERIEDDPNNAIFVATLRVGATETVVGAFQRTFIQHLLRSGYVACQIESVIVARAQRSRGVGATMMRFAIEEARERGCLRVQLTSQKARERAHVFYERLGFVRSHEGMKLWF